MNTSLHVDSVPGHGSSAVAAAVVGDETRGGAPTLRERARPRLAYPATYLLLAINILVFLAMLPGSPLAQMAAAHQFGSVLTAPFSIDSLIRFGGSEAYLVAEGQWWRLLTAAFVHASALHILVNMWCLWNLGVFGEPLLGRLGLISVYLLTGIAGNLLSFAWALFSRQDALVVGASGAVFGIAGILIVLLSNRKLSLPWEELRSLRGQVILFAVANLAIGVAPQLLPMFSPGELARLHVDPGSLPRIDNSAHLGGLLYGMVLGLPLFPRMTSGRSSYRARQRLTFAAGAFLLCLIGYALAHVS